MSDATREFGIIGLGKMGGALTLQAREKGWRVAGFTLGGPSQDLRAAGVEAADRLEDFRELLPIRPRRVLLYIPAGPGVDQTLDRLAKEVVEPGDILVDGGNSYWGDSIRRGQLLREQGIHYVDLGTSGGVSGARNGACFMAGGTPEDFLAIEPLLRDLAVHDGVVHAGPLGAGHFAKLVHNGIEFGMLQAIGEGMNLLEDYPHAKIPIEKILHCWNHGSVIRSWLIELLEQAYAQNDGLADVPAFVEDTGEVNWLISDALHMEVSVPVMATAVMQLFSSRDNNKKWARAIAMMRHGFGGHPYGPAANIAQERQSGRVSDDFLKTPRDL